MQNILAKYQPFWRTKFCLFPKKKEKRKKKKKEHLQRELMWYANTCNNYSKWGERERDSPTVRNVLKTLFAVALQKSL